LCTPGAGRRNARRHDGLDRLQRPGRGEIPHLATQALDPIEKACVSVSGFSPTIGHSSANSEPTTELPICAARRNVFSTAAAASPTAGIATSFSIEAWPRAPRLRRLSRRQL
jgi:hypothetical protein